jgi:hypothetical protein
MDAYELRAKELEAMLTRINPPGEPLSEEAEEHMLAVCVWIERYRKLSQTYTRIILI